MQSTRQISNNTYEDAIILFKILNIITHVIIREQKLIDELYDSFPEKVKKSIAIRVQFENPIDKE